MTTISNLYPNVLKAAAGSVMGAVATHSWSGALASCIAASVSLQSNTKHILITAIGYSALKFGLETFIWNQRIFSYFVSLSPNLFIHHPAMKEMTFLLEIGLASSYLFSAIDYVARYHLGKAALLTGPLLVAGGILAYSSKTHPARPNVDTKSHLLSSELLEKAKPYTESSERFQNLPKPLFGKNPVRFLDELVLKSIGSPENQERLDKMQQARSVCLQNGYKDIVIPRAQVLGDFLVESKLPIALPSAKEQIGLYIENRNLFTNAVKEFTGLLFQSDFPGIVGYMNEACAMLASAPMGRYDNACLYLEENRGKIGLVDLERYSSLNISMKQVPTHLEKDLYMDIKGRIYRFVKVFFDVWLAKRKIVNWRAIPISMSPQSKNNFTKCLDAICFFPLHFNEILAVAERFDPNIWDNLEGFQKARAGSLVRFKATYEDHLTFVKERGININNPFGFVRPQAAVVQRVKEQIERKLRYIHERPDSFYKLLGDNPKETINRFNEETFPRMIEDLFGLIDELLRINFAGRVPSSMPELLKLRSPRLEGPSYEAFMERIFSKLEIFTLSKENKILLVKILVICALEKLSEEKVLRFITSTLDDKEQYSIFC